MQDEGDPRTKARPSAPSTIHDIITGGVEGSLGGLATEPLFSKLAGTKIENPFRSGLGKRLAIGGAVGAGATGLIGALVSMTSKKAKRRPNELERVQDLVTELRYVLVDDQEDGDSAVIRLPGDSKAHAALQGGLIGGGVGTAAGIGAAVALPSLAKRLGLQKSVGRFEEALGGKRGARIKTSLALAGVAGKIGATVGAIQGVASHNEAERRSKAIADALRRARKQGEEKHMSIAGLVRNLTELEATFAYKRSGVRLDKYQKQIRSNEIDRHTNDYIRSAVLGGVAGAVIPSALSLKKRALAGAGVGVATAGLLHAAGHTDAYGEQSEEAKILQRQAPKYLAGAAVIGGLLGRRRKKKFPLGAAP